MGALRALLLRKKIDELNAQLEKKKAETEALRAKNAEFETREAELKKAIEEVTDETPAEDREAVNAEVEKYESEKKANDDAINASTADEEALQGQINSTEEELRDLEAKQEDKHAEKPAPAADRTAGENHEERERTIMNKRFKDLSYEERTAFVQREEVKKFLDNVRCLGKGQTRGITGGDLLIPEVMLPMVKSSIEQYSKLIGLVNTVDIAGNARQTIMGDIPEGIWTEACADLTELNVVFTDKDIDQYRVGGFIPVCNATLEDSDVNLAAELFDAIGNGIGYAVDKAIVYGSGTKMPTGFAATATKKTLGAKTDKALFSAFVEASGDLKHPAGNTAWIVNHKTNMKLRAAAMNVNAAGALVSAADSSMPVEGGAIVEEDFIPDDEIVGGYLSRYLLGRRKDVTLAMSDQNRFVQDQTVFKGTARFDGKPVFNDAFMVVSLTATAPTAAIDSKHPFAGTAGA